MRAALAAAAKASIEAMPRLARRFVAPPPLSLTVRCQSSTAGVVVGGSKGTAAASLLGRPHFSDATPHVRRIFERNCWESLGQSRGFAGGGGGGGGAKVAAGALGTAGNQSVSAAAPSASPQRREATLLQYYQVLERWMDLEDGGRLPIVELLEQMSEEGVPPVQSTFLKALEVCGRQGRSELAKEVLSRMKTLNIDRTGGSVFVLWAFANEVERAVSAAKAVGGDVDEEWRQEMIRDAFATYEELRTEGFTSDAQTFVLLLDLASKSHDRQEMVANVLQDLQNGGFSPNGSKKLRIACTSACMEAGLWDEHEEIVLPYTQTLIPRISRMVQGEDMDAAVAAFKEAHTLGIRVPFSLYSKQFHRLLRADWPTEAEKKRWKEQRRRKRGRRHNSRKPTGNARRRHSLNALELIGGLIRLLNMPELRTGGYLHETQPPGVPEQTPTEESAVKYYWFITNSNNNHDVVLEAFDLLPEVQKLAQRFPSVWKQREVAHALMRAGKAAVVLDRPDYLRRVTVTMRRITGMTPDNYLFDNLIKGCLPAPEGFPAPVQHLTAVVRAVEAGIEAGCKFTLPIFTVLIRALAAAHDVVPASGQIDDALTNAGVAARQRQLAELITDVETLRRNTQGAASLDVVYKTDFVGALAAAGQTDKCWATIGRMRASGVPEADLRVAYNLAFKRLRQTKQYKPLAQGFKLMQKHGVAPDVITAACILEGLAILPHLNQYITTANGLLDLAWESGWGTGILDGPAVSRGVHKTLILLEGLTRRGRASLPPDLQAIGSDKPKPQLRYELSELVVNLLAYAKELDLRIQLPRQQHFGPLLERSLIAPDYVLKVTELIYPQPVSRDRMAFLNFMKAHFLRQEEDGDRKFERLVELL